MTTLPLGPLSLQREYLRQTIAAASYFWTWSGALDVLTAAERIYHIGLPPPAANADEYAIEELAAYRPCVILWTPSGGFTLNHDSSSGFACNGRMRVLALETIAAELDNDVPEACRVMENAWGLIWDEVCERAWSDRTGLLAIDRVDLVDGPLEADKKAQMAQGHWLAMVFDVLWHQGGQ